MTACPMTMEIVTEGHSMKRALASVASARWRYHIHIFRQLFLIGGLPHLANGMWLKWLCWFA